MFKQDKCNTERSTNMSMTYENEQKFFKSVSQVMQMLGGDFDLKQNPNLELSTMEKVKNHLVSPDKQIASAKSNVNTSLKRLMNYFHNFTYKVDHSMTNPNVVHTLVKFKESLNLVMMESGNPEIYTMGHKVDKDIDKLLSLSPIATPRTKTATPFTHEDTGMDR